MKRDETERLARRLEAAAPGPEGLGAGGEARAETARADAARADDELASLVSLAQTLESSAAEPAPRFPAALRERVLATVAEEPSQPAWRAHLRGVVDEVVTAWRYSLSSQIASGVLTAVLLLAAVFVGAGLSVPGDPLYALKDAYQQAQLSRASAPVDVAAVQLEMAGTKIEETVRAVDRGRPDSVISSAADAEQLTRDSAETLLEVYRDTGNEEVLAPLSAFVQGHRPIVTGLQERTAHADARRALANLVITLDRVDARVATALGGCCPPEQQASAFWVMSSPHQLLRSCPCPSDATLADDEGDDADHGAESADDGDVPSLTPGGEDGDAPNPDPERWREDVPEDWDETQKGVRDRLDDATEDSGDAVDDTLDDDPVDELEDGLPSDGATDELGEGVHDSTVGVDDAVEDTTDGVSEPTPEGTDESTESDGDSDPIGELIEEQLDAQAQSAEPTGSGSDGDGAADDDTRSGDGERRARGDADGSGDDGDDRGSAEPDPSLEGMRDPEGEAGAAGSESDGDALP